MPKGDRLKLKADPEDGTTPIANLLLEAVAMAKISGLQKGAILYLWRKTYGWVDKDGGRLKECKITLSEWKKALDSTAPRLSHTLAELEEKGIMKRRVADIWGGYYYSLNTEISKWNSDCINLAKLAETIGIANFATVTENATITENNNSYPKEQQLPKKTVTVTENATQQLPKTQLPTLYKERLKKDIKKKDNKNIYGEFNNVFLTDKEYQKLIERFGEIGVKERIEVLSVGIASKGYKYKDYYATILAWDKRDKKDGKGGTHKQVTTNKPITEADLNDKDAIAERERIDREYAG